MEAAGFEDHVAMLGALRKAMKEQRPDNGESDPFFSLFEDEEQAGPRRETLFALYRKVLEGIERRQTSLTQRERRELAEVMDRFGAEDLPYRIGDPEDAKGLADLLGRFMRAGCLGKRTALVALMAGRRSRSPGVARSAGEILNETGPLQREDLIWVLHEFRDLFLPHLRTLAPVMDRLNQSPILWGILIPELLRDLESSLIAETGMKGNRLPGMPAEGLMAHGDAHVLMRDELKHLGEVYPQLEPLRTFLSCFPKGWNREGFLRWLTYVRGTVNFVPYLVEKVSAIEGILEEGPLPFPFFLRTPFPRQVVNPNGASLTLPRPCRRRPWTKLSERPKGAGLWTHSGQQWIRGRPTAESPE
jgi:hypothetical protein